MYTVEEAKQKWCPFVRLGGLKTMEGCNRVLKVFDGIQEATSCIGAACMAWQWSGSRQEIATIPHVDIVGAGIDAADILPQRTITMPQMQGDFKGFSHRQAKISEVWRDSVTQVAFVSLEFESVKTGKCGLWMQN